MYFLQNKPISEFFLLARTVFDRWIEFMQIFCFDIIIDFGRNLSSQIKKIFIIFPWGNYLYLPLTWLIFSNFRNFYVLTTFRFHSRWASSGCRGRLQLSCSIGLSLRTHQSITQSDVIQSTGIQNGWCC